MVLRCAGWLRSWAGGSRQVLTPLRRRVIKPKKEWGIKPTDEQIAQRQAAKIAKREADALAKGLPPPPPPIHPTPKTVFADQLVANNDKVDTAKLTSPAKGKEGAKPSKKRSRPNKTPKA